MLELKIPPPVVALLCVVAAWGISLVSAPIAVPALFRVTGAVMIALAGGSISVLGFNSFRGARTTVDPRKPETTSTLVTKGIYRFTRNPMYLGILLVLVAWVLFLAAAWALVVPFLFVLYINRFQIAPEERVLLAKFGAEYSAYASSVRRWL